MTSTIRWRWNLFVGIVFGRKPVEMEIFLIGEVNSSEKQTVNLKNDECWFLPEIMTQQRDCGKEVACQNTGVMNILWKRCTTALPGMGILVAHKHIVGFQELFTCSLTPVIIPKTITITRQTGLESLMYLM